MMLTRDCYCELATPVYIDKEFQDDGGSGSLCRLEGVISVQGEMAQTKLLSVRGLILYFQVTQGSFLYTQKASPAL